MILFNYFCNINNHQNMKKFLILIPFLLGNSKAFGQSQVEIVESYIVDQKIESKLSKKVINNHRFRTILINDYFQLQNASMMDDAEKELFLLIQTEFDFHKPQFTNLTVYHYRLEQVIKKSSTLQFSSIFFSKHKNYAIFLAEESSKAFKSEGKLILMELVEGEWRYRATLYNLRDSVVINH